jgi:mono/diheme cytochrome c family protein
MRSLTLVLTLAVMPPALAQQPRSSPGFPDAPGKEVLLGKCFQCHSPGMWADQRQDRRAWEATLYRMVGRGALWSEDEIKRMADYLGATYARDSAVYEREPVKTK